MASIRRVSSSVFDTPVASQPVEQSPFLSPSPAPSLSKPDNEMDLSLISICCVSGGTGGNAICSAFGHQTTWILPISDDGGSSSEILRCLGGPSIGDIRSRLIRLVPSPSPSSSLAAIIHLLSYRLPADVPEQEAKALWREIVEGTSELWDGVAEDRREVLHRFFVHFESELLQRAHKGFSFRNCSLGNVFLSSTQRFFLSLPAAIFLFASITEIQSQCHVIPAILTNHTATIAAELESGETIVGQCNISHPAPPLPPSPEVSMNRLILSSPSQPARARQGKVGVEDGINARFGGQAAGGSGKPEGSRGSNLIFRRTGEEDGLEGEEEEGLESRIKRIFYINVYGQEIFPAPNPEFLSSLAKQELFVYSCGSLWTSIIPTLALEGVGSAILTSPSLKAKIFFLNSSNDRETVGYTALNYIEAIVRTLNHHDSPIRRHPGRRGSILSSTFSNHPSTLTSPVDGLAKIDFSSFRIQPKQLISHIVYLQGSKIEIETEAIEALGIKLIRLEGSGDTRFSTESAKQALREVLADVMKRRS